jgi:hypothetical protein
MSKSAKGGKGSRAAAASATAAAGASSSSTSAAPTPAVATPADFEKLGVFYLGRPYDLGTKQPAGGLLLYDAKDLVTHAVCVGMTGSGKTGLCLALLEEAAIDGIPALVIDPKGDLGNLLLTFPELRPADFRPWIDEDDARRKGVTPDAFAEQQAALWTKGLAAWGEDGARIRRLREAADFAIYTPGSNAGIPVSILKSFAAPPSAVQQDAEALGERISTTVTSLFGLVGVEADPVKSREHILISTILRTAWAEGRDLDLAGLIQQIQSPPVKRVGLLDVDAFFPARDRFALAMTLNNLLAASGFTAWMEGEPLDVQTLLFTQQGKPRVAIFSIAHLGDAERMFFVSLLLNQTLGWMRNQSGTTSLRALVYMDEIFGYFPPVANPPSKQPLLTLLKQARAFGVGVVLATQNPVDLDYKGLSNAGTWLIGRLQTDRDKARVLDGLEGAAAGAGGRFDRGKMEETIAGLGNRIFLMNNVHEDAPVVFETRWVMSYLRGPLTRDQIRTLMADRRGGATAAARATARPAEAPPGARGPAAAAAPLASTPAAPVTAASARPVLPPDIPQQFLPVRGAAGALVYAPMLLGAAQVRFTDAKRGIDVSQDVSVLAPIGGGAVPVDWEQAREASLALADLEAEPAAGAQFAELPGIATKKKSYADWSRDFAGWLFRTRTLELLACPAVKAVSRPGESEAEFRARIQHGAREARDAAAEGLRQKYAPKIAALQDKVRRAQQAVERESGQATQQGLQVAISVGATLLGAFLGRKAVNATTLGRATTAARGAGRAMKEAQDVSRAKESVASLQQQLADLDAEFKRESDAVAAQMDPAQQPLEPLSLKPTKANIAVKLVTLAWAPQRRDAGGALVPAWE